MLAADTRTRNGYKWSTQGVPLADAYRNPQRPADELGGRVDGLSRDFPRHVPHYSTRITRAPCRQLLEPLLPRLLA